MIQRLPLQSLIGALALAACASLGANPRDGLDVRVSAAQLVQRGDGDVSVTVTVTNTTRHPIHLLRWQLPGDEIEGALFRIAHEDGSRVAYTGPLIKRAAPDANDHVKLDAGASLSWQVELTAAYELSRNGRYAIEYASRGQHGAAAKTLQSEPLYLWLEGRSAKAPAAPPAPAAAGITFTGNCSATRQNTLTQAVAAATNYSTGSLGYLNALAGSTPRFASWFGPYSLGARNAVQGNFAKIDAAFKNQPLTLDCSCKTKRTYAYVYSNQPYKIYLCGAFWTAPLTGTDSKAGTLVHEMSHFNVVAGTDDWAYGQTAARNLALTEPTKAIDNADSHEYFAENTPFQN